MLTGGAADLFRLTTGLDDEAMAKLHPGLEKLHRNIPKTVGFQTVAEVVESQACFAGVKVGDRPVFDPFLNPQKSTGTMCPKALLPVLVEISALREMITEWAESGNEELPEIVFRNVRCLDPGLEDGGVGRAIYTIRGEKTTI